MGLLKPEYVIGQVYHNDKGLDKLIEESEGLIVRVEGQANGEVTYFMAWDGSKEGWEISDKFDKIREKFIKQLKNLDATWYVVTDGYESGNCIWLETSYNDKPVMQEL